MQGNSDAPVELDFDAKLVGVKNSTTGQDNGIARLGLRLHRLDSPTYSISAVI
jgi:hypothetical protein